MATAEGTATRRVESFDIATEEVPLPDGISGENGLVRALFNAYDGAEALELVTGDKIIYLLPWAARSGCIAGYEQDLENYRARPVEITAATVREHLEELRPREISLATTPAWLLDGSSEQDVRVTWHARVRWAERVTTTPNPAPEIREAYEQGVSIGIDYGHGRYHSPEDLVLASVEEDAKPLVTTVFRPENFDDFGVNHLSECNSCGEVYNPGNPPRCDCCDGAVCPWCDETVV